MTAIKKKILLVDDDADFLWLTARVLEKSDYEVLQARNGEEGLSHFEKDRPDLVLMDYRMPGRDGLEIAKEMKSLLPKATIIIITGYAEIKTAVKAMRMGAYDYITKPLNQDALLFSVQRALEKQDLEQEVVHLRNVLNERVSLHQKMGSSDPIKKLVRNVERVAPTSFTVLIEGESGTGKELVARAIHDFSQVKDRPFVAVDCGAIPDTLIESELFGYMKGAFTGAERDKPGYFEMADGGTLFLDEVGNLSYTVQQTLLRAVQERMVQRLGGKKSVAISVRIVAATNQSLAKDVESGKFRSDLFFRLNEFSIKIPSLKERTEDIPYLAKKFVDEAVRELGKECEGFISRESLIALSQYPWPGNVRELRNVIRQAVLMCEENVLIGLGNLPFTSHSGYSTEGTGLQVSDTLCSNQGSFKIVMKKLKDSIEKRLIQDVMAEAAGNKSEAARRLKVDYKTLLRKLKFHEIAQVCFPES